MSAASLVLLLALSPRFVVSYNVDTSHPIVYENPGSGGSNSDYFGYSVALSSGRRGISDFSLFVGAPNSTDGRGSVYRCPELGTGSPKTSACRKLGFFQQPRPTLGWLGASMATGDAPHLTVCAPRSEFDSYRYFSARTLGGVCYEVKDALDDDLHVAVGYTENVGRFNLIHGFSVHSTRKDAVSDPGPNQIIGQPGWQSVDFKLGSDRSVERMNDDDLHKDYSNNFGYSVSSGYYFGHNKLRFAAGAPSWLRKGMVVIFERHHLHSGGIKIEGPVLGEYFGASLATGDFDGDGCDDLAIGAPHWGELDFGRVYTYHSKIHGNFKKGQTLEGKAGKGQFGYTLASADLDHDGYADLIVGAPWEESGAVYVYYGRRDFAKSNPSAQIIQRIVPSAFENRGQIQRFGFSLSHPVDIDDNGYPDLAIGAYKSGHAVVLRSRPVIETKIELESYPPILQISTKNFIISVCVTYEGTRAPASQALSFDMTVDAQHNRVKDGPLKQLDGSFSQGERSCVNETMSLIMSEHRNLVDSFMIDVKHSVKEGENGSKIDAVLSRTSFRRSASLTVPINTGCQRSTVCNARLSVNASFVGVGKDNVWVVGSKDISVNIMVENDNEPAYETKITIVLPPKIDLRKPINICETTPGTLPDTLSLACRVGNPLLKGKPKSFKIDLDVSKIDMRSANSTVLIFNITKSTRSVDQRAKDSTKILELNTKHDAHVSLTGTTDKKYIDYARIADKSKVLVQHAYQVLKSGPSPIRAVCLTIDVPTSMIGKNGSFVNISDPKPIDGSGEIHTCSITDTWSIDQLLHRERRETSGGSGEAVTPGSMSTEEIPDNEPSTNTPKGEVTIGGRTGKTIHLNCSTEGVSCTRVTCPFDFLKYDNDVGNMALDMTLDAEAFYTSDEDPLTIEFHTNAWVIIESPAFADSTYTTNRSAEVSTTLYNIPEPQKVSGWILPCSIVFGILLFCILAVILSRVGFFNRSKKWKAARAKDQKLIVKAQDNENGDENWETYRFG